MKTRYWLAFLRICNKVARFDLPFFVSFKHITIIFLCALVAGFRRFFIIFNNFVWKIKNSVVSLC